ncbi:MAG: hypothetical protein VSS75_029685 [Candidatus Parabeggiatoa sp.]|nr:hypothetical protein [Candidatus Parabeggiatoa sp.]
MLDLEYKVDELGGKVDRLEILFSHFMVQSSKILNRLERMDQQAAQDRERWDERFARSNEKWEKRFAAINKRMADSRADWEKQMAELNQQLADSDDIWEKEIADSRADWKKQMAELNQQLADSDDRWEKRIAEADQRWTKQMADSDERWEKRIAESDERWDKRMAESAKEWKKETKELNRRWGELANKMGTIPEDIVAPNIPRLAETHFGCTEITDFMVRRQVRHKRDPTKRREFDVIAVYPDKVIVNETKSTPTIEYINSFIKALEDIEGYFPEYQGKTIIPIFASLYMGNDIVNYLTKKKIFAMAMGDETMMLLNAQHVPLVFDKGSDH